MHTSCDPAAHSPRGRARQIEYVPPEPPPDWLLEPLPLPEPDELDDDIDDPLDLLPEPDDEPLLDEPLPEPDPEPEPLELDPEPEE